MRIIRSLFVFIFTFSLPCTPYAFDINGWWKSDSKNEFLNLVDFNNGILKGDTKYEIIDDNGNKMTIRLYMTPTYSKNATVIINNENSITITYPSKDTITYERLTKDASISKQKAYELIGDKNFKTFIPKTDQSVK